MSYIVPNRFLGIGLLRRTKAGVPFTPPTSNPPVNTAAPVLSGTPRVPNVLSVTNGSWTNTPTSYTYAWFSGGVLLPSITANSYTLQTSDIGNNVRCDVTATNSDGSTTAASNSLGPILAALVPPVNTVAPVISGQPIQAFVLTTDNGSWTASPTSYTYQWKRGAANIASATANTYTLVSADNGTNITCVVTAINADGSTSATSNAIGPIESTASLWKPTSNANCVLNLDASVTASILPAPSDGSAVDSWADADARGVTLTQATAINKPAWKLSDTTGRPCLVFATSNMSGALSFTKPAAVFYAVATLANTSQTTAARLIVISTAGIDSSVSGAFAAIMRSGSLTSIKSIVNNISSANAAIGAFDLKAILCAKHDGTNLIDGVNGIDTAAVSVATSFTSTRVVIGARAIGSGAVDAAVHWDGQVNQFLVFGAYLAQAEEQKVQGYLAWRWWGSGAPLDVAHPYKNRPPPG